jgi:dynein heavy chain
LNSTTACSLIFYLQGTELCASVKPGAHPPGRCVFFLKPTPEFLTPENFDGIVASGESAGDTLPCISSILDPNKTSGSIDDVLTSLPLPAIDFSFLETKIEEGEDGGIHLDRSTLIQLESAVSTWLSIVDISLSRPNNVAEKKEIVLSAKQGESNHLLSSSAVAAALSWEIRAADLESLNKQLQHRSITMVTQTLLKTDSSVVPSFLRSCYNVSAAAEEARAIAIALEPLLPLFERLYSSENLINASDAITMCMHGIFLAWQHCDALRSSSIAIPYLVRAMANDVVDVAQRCVYGAELLQDDLNEASNISRSMLRMLGHMKSCYADARDKASTLATHGEDSISFPTTPRTFRAIDALMARCQDIHTVCKTSNQYSKLEKIELGGPEGGAFTATARHLYSEFANIQEKMISQGSGTVDPFDLTHSIFPTAILGWKNGIKQLDARLSVFITRVLEAAPTFDVCCRIIESLEALCDRPIARRCIERVHLKAIKTYVHEMRAVEEIFECEKAAPPVALGAPPCAGAVAWVRGLQERLSVPMARFRNLNQSILQSKTGREMMRVYESVLRTLRSHEDSVMAAWCETSAGISDSTMKQPVLLQTLISPLNNSDTLHFTQTSTVQVNFDPALSLLLKEVRALTAMPGLSRPIPAAALALFQQEFALTQHISALKQLAAELNAVRSSLLAVEGPLVASALTAAENIAEKGHREVTWASKELDSFCSNASQCAIEISQQVKVLREVVDATEADIQQWQKDFPLSFSATDSANNMNSFASLKASAVGGASYTTTNSLKSFVNLNTWLETAAMHRSRAVDEGSKKLSTRLATAAEDLGLVPTSPSWVEYSRYVSTIAQKGCFDAVIVSLEALATLLVVEQGENGFSMPPLLTVALHVASGTEGLQWSPQLGSWRNEKNSAPGKGLPNTIAEMLEKYVFALLRLCSSLLPGHQIELEETSAVENALAAVRTAFDTSVARCKSAASQIFTFQHEIASTCAAAAAILSNSTSGEDGVLEKQVLDKIETEIHRLRALQDSIHQIPSLQTPLGWISMDFEPAKQALATAAGKHVALLTAKIKDHVQKELDSTMDYISKALDTIQSASIIVQVKERRPTIRGSSLEASRRATTMVAPTAGQRSSLMGRASTFSSFSKLSSRTSVVSDAGSTGSRRTSTAAPTAASVAVDPQQLYSLLRCFKEVNHRVSNSDAELGPLLAASSMLQRCGAPLSEEAESILRECPQAWRSLTRKASAAKEALSPVITAEIADVKNLHSQFNREVGEFRIHFQKAAPFGLPSGRELTAAAVEQAIAALDKLQLGTSSGSDVSINLHDFNSRSDSLQERRELLDIASSSQPGSCSSAATSFVDNTVSSSSGLKRCQEEADSLRLLWDEISTTLDIFSSWDALPWPQVDAEALGEECKRKNKDLKSLPRSVREYDSYKILESKVKGISTVLPLIKDLAHPAMKDRHWAALGRALNASLPSDPASLTLGALLDLRLDRCADACAEVVDTAKKEAVVEKALTKIESGWEVLTLGFTTIANAPPTTPPCLVVDETVIEALESDGVTLQNLSASKAVSGNPTFRSQVATWQKKLSNVDVVLSVWNDTQRKWTALEAIFCASADIRAQLPEEAALFDQVNSDFKELMMAAPATPAVLDACAVPGRRERLEMLLRSLELRERALQDYLETKRQAFPRFYFVSTADLLDILAKGGDPHSVEHHLPKLFDNLHRLEWKKDENTGQRTHIAIGMYSGEGEYVKFDGECNCTGAVEVWLAAVVDAMRAALRAEYRAAMPAYEEKPRSKWIFDYSAQTTILVSRTYFTQQVNDAFAELEGGNEDALKNLLERQKAQLSEIINLINGPLSKNDRKKLITLCTIDVHARDVVQRLIEDRCEAADVFAWQSQLRYIQDPKTGDPLVQICDADIPYQFEYIGNCGCLCITPLTDRCYITLTQAQRLILGR